MKKYGLSDLKPGFTYCTASGIIGILVSHPQPSDWRGYLSSSQIDEHITHELPYGFGVQVFMSDIADYVLNVSTKSILTSLNDGLSECLREGD